MSKASKLWLVKIHPDDFEYDEFVSGVAWGETAEDAEQAIRANGTLPKGEKTRLLVEPAPTSGVVHEHWHPG